MATVAPKIKCKEIITQIPFEGDSIGCSKDSGGFSLFIISAVPTADQINKMCASATCMSLVAAIKTVQRTECEVAFGFSLYKEILNPIDAGCSNKTLTATPAPPPTLVTNSSSASPNGTLTPTPTLVTNNSLAPSTDIPIPTLLLTAAPNDAKSGGPNTPTIAAAGGGGVLFILLVSIIVLLLRRRRERPADTQNRKLDRPAGHDGFAYRYADRSEASTDDSMNGSDLLRGVHTLASVRIPPGDLQLGEVESQGGFGGVLRGVYRNELVAIKRLLASRRKDATNIRSFFEEIQRTASLDHECIVRFIGVSWDVPANLCMVSEFMHGGDLRSLLVRYALQDHSHGHDDGKLRIAVQVAHAMTYLHSLETPVVHRDLKSRNILLTESLDAKIIDFGISCERQDVTMTAGVGTSLWMAPEVMLGKRYDEKADVFSFGVVLSELDTHQLPYNHVRDTSSNRKMADMVVMQLICDSKLQPRFTEMADPEMVSLAHDCLQMDPAKRPLASEVLYRMHKIRQQENAFASVTGSVYTSETRGMLWLQDR